MDQRFQLKDSKNYIFGALSVLGDDYTNMLLTYYQPWIDFAQDKGNNTGAFCASPYFTHSYVFISWTGKMAEAFVLAHELGHGIPFHITKNMTTSSISSRFTHSLR